LFQRLPIRCMSSSGPVLWPPSETRGAPSENEGDLIPRAGWEFELPSQHDGEFSPTSYPDASVDSNAKNASESIVGGASSMFEPCLHLRQHDAHWADSTEHPSDVQTSVEHPLASTMLSG